MTNHPHRLNKWLMVLVASAAALMASGCVTVTMASSFDTDGSGAVGTVISMDSSSIEGTCDDSLLGQAPDGADLPAIEGAKRTVEVTEEDGTCTISVLDQWGAEQGAAVLAELSTNRGIPGVPHIQLDGADWLFEMVVPDVEGAAANYIVRVTLPGTPTTISAGGTETGSDDTHTVVQWTPSAGDTVSVVTDGDSKGISYGIATIGAVVLMGGAAFWWYRRRNSD